MNDPWFFPSNPHAQTVLRSWLPERPSPLPARRTLILPDGDLLDLDILHPTNGPQEGRDNAPSAPPAATLGHGPFPSAAQPLAGRAVILLHGLEGSSRRPYIQAMLHRIAGGGGVGVAMNFRGCGGSENRSRTSYHAGWIQDLEEVVRWTASSFPDHSLGIVGFSLGAAITLNFLARSPLSERIASAAAISPPLDMRRISLHLQHGMARAYERYFLASLREKTKAKQSRFHDYPTFTGRSLYAFDDQVTAPVHGFASAEDYYASCSGRRFLPDIKAPTLLVHSLDDPICVMDREESEALGRHPMIHPCITGRGGHVAFLTLPGGWLALKVTGFLASKP